VPQSAEIVRAVVESVCEHGVEPGLITILRTSDDAQAGGEPPDNRLSAAHRSAVSVVVHNPETRSELAYLASTADGQTIYLNRALSDADLVVPIGRASWRRAGDGFATLETLYPTFSDVATQDRFAKLTLSAANRSARADARQEVREVNWLLGVLFAVQVVPAGSGGVLDIIAGQPDAVRRLARERCEQAWNFTVPHRASLVVAAIEGDSSEQTWESVGRALAAASRAVSDNGTIAICTQLDARPGPSIKHLGEAEDLHQAVRQIRKQRAADALPATQLARAMDRARVYLLSGLDDELVEALGMAPVSAADDIPRLAARHASCILLGNAQHAVATPLSDD
jgi:nickel-dependent lactate racemase